MKYIYYIVLIACVLTGTVFFLIQSNITDGNPEDYAILINDRNISLEDFKKRFSSRPPHLNKYEFIESVISKELLIQEARRLKIDQEESFRRSIQNFYEQSLTKILMERKYNELKDLNTRQETDRYLDLLGREITLTLINQSPTNKLEQESSQQVTPSTIKDMFENLSTDLKINILQLSPGETSEPIKMFGKEFVLQLNSVGNKSKTTSSESLRDSVDKIISEYKKEQSLQKWLYELRSKSSIDINTKL